MADRKDKPMERDNKKYLNKLDTQYFIDRIREQIAYLGSTECGIGLKEQLRELKKVREQTNGLRDVFWLFDVGQIMEISADLDKRIAEVERMLRGNKRFMTLHDFVQVFKGGACISIEGFCEEEHYDYFALPPEEQEDFSGNNPNGYIPSCLEKEPWYEQIEYRKVKRIIVIGGGMYKTELCIKLEKEETPGAATPRESSKQ